MSLDVFKKITTNYLWDSTRESMSGCGSTINATKILSEKLVKFIKDNNIKSVADVMGDGNWQHQYLNKVNVEYYGYDLVQECVEKAKQNYNKNKVNFKELGVKDIIVDEFPKADIIIVRDVYVHFPLCKIKESLKNIKDNYTYIGMTNFTGWEKNVEIPFGSWRPLDFTKEPFSFPQPEFILDEGLKGFNKTISIWSTKNI